MASRSYVITEKQLKLLTSAEAAVREAMSLTEAIVSTIVAGLDDFEEGGSLERMAVDPPSLVFTYPEPEEQDVINIP
tara:strand:- start:29 stop:259 length:231 start_codon:yes stop_codon:yes gene_type:complete